VGARATKPFSKNGVQEVHSVSRYETFDHV
jgi:hypothetical protein